MFRNYLAQQSFIDGLRITPIKALLDAQMSDHPGLSTFHAEGPNAMIRRMSLKLGSDEKIDKMSAKEMIMEAVDLVVQVRFVNNRRAMIGVWEVEKILKAGDVQFRQLYVPGDIELKPVSLERRVLGGLFDEHINIIQDPLCPALHPALCWRWRAGLGWISFGTEVHT